MSKTIIVTSGPTNEKIDDVMKITNMSTGNLGAMIADAIHGHDPGAKIYYLATKLSKKPNGVDHPLKTPIQYVPIESTDDLLRELTRLLTTERVDAVVHSAAVGDYKTRYAARGEDIAREIAAEAMEALSDPDPMDENKLYNLVLGVLSNPGCLQDPNSKISSYEPNLMAMLDLTPKVIGHIKELSPDTMLIGSKLLDHVAKRELFDVGSALRKKNKADYVIANDLSLIGGGKHPAMIIGQDPVTGEDGVVQECHVKSDIAQAVVHLIYGDVDTAVRLQAPAEDAVWELSE